MTACRREQARWLPAKPPRNRDTAVTAFASCMHRSRNAPLSIGSLQQDRDGPFRRAQVFLLTATGNRTPLANRASAPSHNSNSLGRDLARDGTNSRRPVMGVRSARHTLRPTVPRHRYLRLHPTRRKAAGWRRFECRRWPAPRQIPVRLIPLAQSRSRPAARRGSR